MIKYTLLSILLLLATIGHAENLTGTWTGLLNAGAAKLHLVFHLQKDANGKDVCFMDSPDQSVKGIPTQLQYISADSVSIAVPAIGAKYNGKLNGEIINGIFEQMSMKFPLNLKKEILTYNRPQHPHAPYPYLTEDVTFVNPSANVTLAGTLAYPIGYKKGDKVPVALMVNGSGPETRDCLIYEHLFFRVIADYLARNGIATLRYDDRAVGKSTGDRLTVTTEEVADDAQAGVEFLRKMNVFSKVGILGHSEGANVAFILGAKNKVDFAVAMAATGVKGDECLYSQAKNISELSGQPFALNKEQYTQMVLSQKNPWLQYFMNYNPQPDIQKTTCPVFAINGDKDTQVIASLNLQAVKENMPQNKKSNVKLYPGLNHLFQECTTGLPNEYINIEQTISPEVLKDIADWIQQLK